MELLTDCLKAFAVGGALCAVGQILIDRTGTDPGPHTHPLRRDRHRAGRAGAVPAAHRLGPGAGAAVPLTGFGNTLAKGVREAVAEQGVLGAFTGGLTASAGGITAAIVFGFLAALVFKPREK